MLARRPYGTSDPQDVPADDDDDYDFDDDDGDDDER
jgi:hypothetical protein